jgi:hypothetical protein
VQRLHREPVAVAHEAFAQRAAVTAGLHPQAAVRQRGVFQREPEGRHGLRFGDEEAGVLVPAHLAADARLLEDHLRLPDLRLLQPQVGGQRGQSRAVRERVEHRVQVVQRMADLVDRQRLRLAQPALHVEGLFLEEALHGFGAGDQGGVRQPLGLRRREHRGLRTGLERVDPLACAPDQCGTFSRRLEGGQHQEAVAFVSCLLFGGEHGAACGVVGHRRQRPAPR